MKLTDWIPATEKPVRDGWYEIICDEDQEIQMRLFVHNRWYFQAYDGHMMPSMFGEYPIAPGEAWRGLAEEPK